MGRNLRFWLASPGATPFDPGDAPVALGALLVRLARTELACALSGPSPIDAVLALRYDLTAQEAAEMRETCERIEAAAPETLHFAAVLREAVDYHDRLAIALCLSEVALGRELLRPQQEAIVALAEAVLGVHPQDVTAPRRAG